MPNAGGVRAVVDTNVVVSGLLWHGPPHVLMERVRGGVITLISSPGLLAEFEDVIRRRKLAAALVRARVDPERTLAELRSVAEIIDPPPLPARVSRDPDDDAILALAVAARADFVVTGDADLLTIGSYAGIAIIDATEAVARTSA